MRWKSHVQCEAGEKSEITSNSYLSLFSGLKRNFDLSPLIQLYLYVMNNFEELSNNVREFTIGRCTIVFQVDEEKNINLITGWTGSRKKIN